MSKILALMGQKGGSGKTTICRALAVAAQLDGLRVLIIDADPQMSAVKWSQRRASAPPQVLPAGQDFAGTLRQALAAGPDIILIDTPPHLRATMSLALEAATAILIPCRPTPEDLEAVGPTLALARGAGKMAGLTFNAVPPRASSLPLARSALSAAGSPISPVALMERTSHPYASADGLTAQEREPNSKAAQEVAELWTWVRDTLLS